MTRLGNIPFIGLSDMVSSACRNSRCILTVQGGPLSTVSQPQACPDLPEHAPACSQWTTVDRTRKRKDPIIECLRRRFSTVAEAKKFLSIL